MNLTKSGREKSGFHWRKLAQAHKSIRAHTQTHSHALVPKHTDSQTHAHIAQVHFSSSANLFSCLCDLPSYKLQPQQSLALRQYDTSAFAWAEEAAAAAAAAATTTTSSRSNRLRLARPRAAACSLQARQPPRLMLLFLPSPMNCARENGFGACKPCSCFQIAMKLQPLLSPCLQSQGIVLPRWQNLNQLARSVVSVLVSVCRAKQ